MIPEKLTVQELFSRERRFVIPLFQRSYVWDREKQWEPLWEDILRRAEAHLIREQSGGEGRVRSHFLGAIVLSNARAQGRSIARCDVIDGQQRLTTLQLFLAALRDRATVHDADPQDTAIFRDLTRNPRCEDDSDERFKVWPTNADQNTFVKVMGGGPEGYQSTDSGSASPRMAQAYSYFSEEIDAFVSSEEYTVSVKDRFYGLMLALKESLHLVVIELEADDDPQIIFETLNARGQPLLPSDLIRNYIFMKVGNTDANKLYDAYWRHFDDDRVHSADIRGEDRFWHLEEQQGRLTRPRIDLFIFHYLKMKTEDDIRIGQLFREFRHWYEESETTDLDFLRDLKLHSEYFRKIVAPSGNSRLELFASRLKSLDTATAHPLLLFLAGLEANCDDQARFDRCIMELESFMVRRFICDLTTKNYNRFFLSVLASAKEAHRSGASPYDAIHEELTRSKSDTTVWPSDREFAAKWPVKRLYVKSRPDRSAMILKAIQAEMTTRRSEAISLDGPVTVEHLLPQQGLVTDYPYSENLELPDGITRAENRESLLHTVGNLTLLTGSLNASVSNGPFDEKAIKIAGDSDLRLNAWLRNEAPSSWDEDSILSRSAGLFAYAKAIWPAPS